MLPNIVVHSVIGSLKWSRANSVARSGFAGRLRLCYRLVRVVNVASGDIENGRDSVTGASPVSRLTSGQLDCLRLVDQHLSSRVRTR